MLKSLKICVNMVWDVLEINYNGCICLFFVLFSKVFGVIKYYILYCYDELNKSLCYEYRIL